MILVDTHVVVWLALQPERISKKARTAIVDARRSGQGIRISDITLLEISTLERKTRHQAQFQPGDISLGNRSQIYRSADSSANMRSRSITFRLLS